MMRIMMIVITIINTVIVKINKQRNRNSSIVSQNRKLFMIFLFFHVYINAEL